MKLSYCVFAAALALALSAGSAAADEQLNLTKNVSQPTVMSDAELDQIVAGGLETYERVGSNRTNAFDNSGGNAKSVTSKAQGQGKALGASGAWFGISLNPSP